MIIEQVDALKVWLTNKLSPICDAEPSALAKYVCALVKKDKQEQDLRDICVDQLDVFLQQNTKPFVDELFEVLKSKIYIPPATETKPRPPPPPPLPPPIAKSDSKSPSHQAGKEKDDGQRKKVSEISSTTDEKDSKDTSPATATASSNIAAATTTTAALSSSKDSAGESVSRVGKDPPREVREPRATSREGRDRERDDEVSRDRKDSWKDDRVRDGIRESRDGFRDSRDGIRDSRDAIRDSRDANRDSRDTIRDAIRDSRDIRDGFRDSRDGVRDSRDGIRDARDSIRDSRETFRDAKDGFRDAKDGFRDAKDGFRDAKDGFRDAKDGFRDARDGARDLRDSIRDSRDGNKDSRDGIRDSKDGIKDAKDGIRDSRDGIKDSKDGIRDSRDGIKDSRDIRDSRDGIRDSRDGIRDSRDGVKDARDGTRDTREGIRDARDIIRDRERDKFDSRQDTREVREPRDRDFRDRDRDRDFRRRRTRSRSFSPRRRDYDADRRRRFEERPRFSPERRWGRRRSTSRSPRRNRSPLDRGAGRPRSRSPRLRSRSPRDRYRPFRSRTRSRTRSRSPRPRSGSRPGSWARPRTKSPSNTRLPDSRGSTPLQDNDFISSSTNDLPMVTSIVGYRPLGEEGRDGRLPPVQFEGPPPPFFVQGGRNRCRSFEEKGYCVQGDLCPYDHGSDPVVLEDTSIHSVLSGPPNPGIPTSVRGFVAPDMRVPPPGHMGVRINLQRPPPPPPPHVEPYLPEAPGLDKLPFMRGPPLNLHLPPPGMLPSRPPPQADHFYVPGRDVVISNPSVRLPDSGDHDGPMPDKEPSRIVIPAKRPYSAIGGDTDTLGIGVPPPRMPHLSQPPLVFEPTPLALPPFPVQLQQAPPPRRTFDYSRLGVRGKLMVPRPQFRPGNLTLEVRKIPHEFNNIAKLNEHFGKFGNLTNIQVKFQGDPGAALITFSNSSEANAAYRSPEPVFNNRFIKLFWHNAEKHINLDGETENPVVVTVGEDGRNVQIQQTTVTGGRVGDGIDHPSLMLPVRPSIPPAHKLQLDNTKPKTNVPAAATAPSTATSEASNPSSSPTADKSIVYTSSLGNLKKTVFNPSATATPAVARSKSTAPSVSPTAVKTADHVSRMEAISRAEEERKLAAIKQAELEQKKQELLAKQIQQQKLLLDTLEKKKATMSEEEKKDLYKALRTISDAIDKVKYGLGAKRPQVTVLPTPVPDQFKYNSSHEQTVYSGRGRGWPPARGSGWPQRGRGHLQQFLGRTHLDNRPKTIEVKGFELSELEEIKLHFQRFGGIEKVDVVEEVPSVFLTYASRLSAEVAVSQGGKFKKKTLIVRWNQMTPKISRTESTQSSEVDEDLSITLGSLNEESLQDASGMEKPDEVTSSLFTSQTTPEQDKDLSVFEDAATPPEDSLVARAPKPVFERSLSEDLLTSGEEHFKASYTDDEDEEDHITVTLSNVISSAPPPYSSNAGYNNNNIGGGGNNHLLGQDGTGTDILGEGHNFDSSSLDYTEGGPWV